MVFPGHVYVPLVSGLTYLCVSGSAFLEANWYLANPNSGIESSLTSHEGNVIHRQSQLSLAKSDTRYNAEKPNEDGVMLVTGGLYAPTIRYHEGVFYVVCTNILHDGPKDTSENFIVSTRDIWSGEWSDVVYFDFKGIDPSLLFDDDRKVYVQGSRGPGPMTKIANFQIDLETGKKLSEERIIWEGTGGIYPEGPHIYKRKGWYYLMISEGGTHEGHMITMARARDIWGPYEPCPDNPILTARGTDEYIRCTGHCDAFEDEHGQWWGVCLGIRKDAEGRYIMGRESFLTRAHWDTEWLSFEQAKSDPIGLDRKTDLPILDAAPNVDFLHIRDADLSKYSFADSNGPIVLEASPIDLSDGEKSPTFVGKRQRLLTGQTVAMIRPIAAWEPEMIKAGVAVYKDEHRYARIYYDAAAGEVAVEVTNNAKTISRHVGKKLDKALTGTGLALRLSYTEQQYVFQYALEQSDGQREWVTIATTDTMDLTGPDFVGPVCGVFAVANGLADTKVEFHDFQVK